MSGAGGGGDAARGTPAHAEPGRDADPRAVAVLARLARDGVSGQALRDLSGGPLAQAMEAAAAYARDALSPATQAAYLRDWLAFAAWCAGPMTSTSTCCPSAQSWLRPTSRTSRPATAAAPCAAASRRSPTTTAAALTSVEIKQLVATCADDLRGFRDRALFLAGFAGAFRRSELVGLDVEHLRFDADCVVIHLPRSKGDQEGKGADVTLPRMRDAATGVVSATCPVRALELWLRRAKIAYGAVFRAISVHNDLEARLTARGVYAILQHRPGIAQLTVHASERLSPHGMRAGLITEAYLAGAPDEQVGGHTRHADLRTMRGYRRRARITGDNPARLVDL